MLLQLLLLLLMLLLSRRRGRVLLRPLSALLRGGSRLLGGRLSLLLILEPLG